MVNGKWEMENGKWEMENGKWKMENKLCDLRVTLVPSVTYYARSRPRTAQGNTEGTKYYPLPITHFPFTIHHSHFPA